MFQIGQIFYTTPDTTSVVDIDDENMTDTDIDNFITGRMLVFI